MQIGVIGLGSVGYSIAASLFGSGHDVYVQISAPSARGAFRFVPEQA